MIPTIIKLSLTNSQGLVVQSLDKVYPLHRIYHLEKDYLEKISFLQPVPDPIQTTFGFFYLSVYSCGMDTGFSPSPPGHIFLFSHRKPPQKTGRRAIDCMQYYHKSGNVYCRYAQVRGNLGGVHWFTGHSLSFIFPSYYFKGVPDIPFILL